MREIGYDKYTEYIVDNHIYYHVYSKDHKSGRKTGLPNHNTVDINKIYMILSVGSHFIGLIRQRGVIKDLMKKWHEKYFLAEKFGNFKNYN